MIKGKARAAQDAGRVRRRRVTTVEEENGRPGLAGRRVLLVVSGGIAAYKAAEVVRRLRAEGAEVRVVMTAGALRFVGTATFQALSACRVRHDLWDEEAEGAMGHIELARWAEVVVVAPASAHLLARFAHGLADDLATTLVLATEAPLLLAPAMNRVMWSHPATRANVALLRARGAVVLEPEQGEQACGESGPGRLPEPPTIVAAARSLLGGDGAPCPRILAHRRVVVTAGPTREPLDAVRYLSNRSSGRMGYAVARAAREAGAEVVLVSGPVALDPPAGVRVVRVETALEMREAALAEARRADVFVAVAAVADYRPERVPDGKPAKDPKGLRLTLLPNPDIVAEVGRLEPRPFVVGFAAETEALEAHCRAKLERKGLDMIAGNLVGPERGFDREDNALHVFWRGGEARLECAPKEDLARRLLALVAQRLAAGDRP
jgi:phosphopantothenoylcysteine decarboxylase/phosphopantothenate--cysteine ligase